MYSLRSPRGGLDWDLESYELADSSLSRVCCLVVVMAGAEVERLPGTLVLVFAGPCVGGDLDVLCWEWSRCLEESRCGERSL